MSNAKRCWRVSLSLSRRRCLFEMQTLKRSVLSVRPWTVDRFALPAARALDEACASGFGPSRTAQEVSKTSGDAPRRPDIAAQAPGASLWPPYRGDGQIWAVATPCGMSNAKRCWSVGLSSSRRRCLFEIQPLKRSVLSVRLFAPTRSARPSPRALDEACASGPRPSRTAQEVSKTSWDCASSSVPGIVIMRRL